MKVRRLVVVASLCLLVVAGVQHAALAITGSCSRTQVQPGDSITVSGHVTGTGTDLVRLFFESTQIGQTASSASGFYAVTGQIPSDAVPGVYQIGVIDSVSSFNPCTVTVTAAATPTPTPTPTPVPTPVATAPPASPVASFPVFIPISVSQQQQQQQQQQGGGGGGRAPAGGQQQQGHGGAGGQQQQQQQQQSGGDGILPRTGADTGRMAAGGGVLLGFGLVLVLFARRRRSRARRRVLAELPPIDAVVVEPERPWLPGTAHPSEFLTEADGLPPVYLPVATQLALPPAPVDDEDILTPSF